MADAPTSHIPPCNDTFTSRLINDWCHDCGHVLATHRKDNVCTICDATADLRTQIAAELERLRRS